MGLFDNFAKSRGYEKADTKSKKSAADIVSGGSWGEIFGGSSSPAFSSFNSQKEQLAAYVDWVYAATRYIAETCATIDLRIFNNHTTKSKTALGQKLAYSRDNKALQQEVNKLLKVKKTIIVKDAQGKLVTKQVAPLEELETHPVLDLLDCPNPYMTRTEFFEMTFLHLELAGEAFWAINRSTKNGPPTELWPLMPNLMSVVADKEKFILGYMYTVGGEQLPFAPEDIIHHKYSNPNDLRRGMSPVQAAARIIDTDVHMADHNRRIFYNGATVDAVLYTEQKLNDENWKRLNSQWKDQYSGTSNAHKTAILENGLKYQPMALSNKDLNFLEGMNFNRDMILAIFGVPKSLLGMDESMSRANAEAAEYAFSKNKVRPKMLRLTSRITEDLAVQFGSEDILVSFTDPVPDDKEFLLKEKQASVGTTNALGWRTQNEIRAEDGSDPVEGGDELWIEGTMVPMAYAAKEPEPEDKPAVAEENPAAPNNDDSAEDTGDQDNEDGGDSSSSSDDGSQNDNNSSAGDAGSTTSSTSTGDKSVKDMSEGDPKDGGDLTPDVKPLEEKAEAEKTKGLKDNAKFNPNHGPDGRFTTGGSDEDEKSTTRANAEAMHADAASENVTFQSQVSDLAAQLGTSSTAGPIKTVDKITQKATNDYGGNVNAVRDSVRATLVLRNPADVNKYMDAIKSQFSVTRIKDGLNNTGYQDAKANVKLPSGYQAEIQMATPEMLYAKSSEGGGGHALYNSILSGKLSPEETTSATDQMNQLYADAAAATAARLSGKSFVRHDTSSKVADDIKATAKSQDELMALHKTYEDVRNRVSNKYEGEFMKVAHKQFESQKKEVLRNVRTRFKSYKATKSVTKAQKKKTDSLFNKAASAAAWGAALVPIYRGAVNTAGNAAFNYVSDASTIGTSAQFSGADPAIIDFYEQRTNLVSVGIDDTTDRLLKTSLIEGISDGEDVSELADRVEAIYGAAAGYRAQRIARTESIDSTSFASVEAWEQSGVVTGKKWFVGGPNPCPHCLDMDGKQIGLSVNFFDKGDSLTVGEGESAQTMNFTYDNVDGPPLHPNCACTLLPILAT